MDVYLSREARQHLRAALIISPKACGFLLGHKRGHRFFIESIIQSSNISSFSPKKRLQLDELFPDRIIGYFASLETDEVILSRLLVPHATGRIFLRITSSEEDGMTIEPSAIDFDQRFFLSPIELKPL